MNFSVSGVSHSRGLICLVALSRQMGVAPFWQWMPSCPAQVATLALDPRHQAYALRSTVDPVMYQSVTETGSTQYFQH